MCGTGRAMNPGRLPDVAWLDPLPLEGVKSRKRAVFSVPRAYLKNKSKKWANTFSGLELALESRVAVVGDKLGCITDILLGASETVTGTVSRHDGLSVLHLGPQLLDAVGQSTEQYLAAAAAALEKRPHVVVLDEAPGAGNKAWSHAFHYLLDHHTRNAFRGALVICVAEETAAVKHICKHRWTGAREWFWQEVIEEDNGLELFEDVLSRPEMLDEQVMQEVRDLASKIFVEDLLEECKVKDWNLTVLTMPSSLKSEEVAVQDQCCDSGAGADQCKTNDVIQAQDQCKTNDVKSDKSSGQRTLAGLICYNVSAGGATFNISRVAVTESVRKGGYGRRLMRLAFEKAAQMQDVAWIGVSALDSAVPFYERFGFMDMTDDDLEDERHFQTWMEMPNAPPDAVFLAPPLAEM